MAAIHHISKGQMKVIIVPHDSHALRGTNDIPCDAYCEKLNGAYLDFYGVQECRSYLHPRSSKANGSDRELYKQRLDVLFKHYPSRAFDGRPWAELSEIILVCLSVVH
jgi:hypothetical protein